MTLSNRLMMTLHTSLAKSLSRQGAKLERPWRAPPTIWLGRISVGREVITKLIQLVRSIEALMAMRPGSLAVSRINAAGPAMVEKHFLPLLRTGHKTVFAALSARVGSISDNRLGGWASYRASKAALNMLLKTLAIEHARRYAPYLVAAVDVEGDFGKAGNKAFRLLARYTFGDNEAGEKMSMTAPVESRPAEEGVRMSMTAPVTSTASATDQYTYAFVMEQKYTLPQPRDPRIRLKEHEARVMAVRRY